MDRNFRRRIKRAEKQTEKRVRLNEELISQEQIISDFGRSNSENTVQLTSSDKQCSVPLPAIPHYGSSFSEPEDDFLLSHQLNDVDNSDSESEYFFDCIEINDTEKSQVLYYEAIDDDLPPIIDSDCDDENDIFEYQGEQKEESFCEKVVGCLRDCASLSGDFKQSTMNCLLSLLKERCPAEFAQLPKDARTVMKTPRKVKVDDMGGGKFAYLGLAKFLLKILALNKIFALGCDNLNLLFNIDGLPIFKSTKLQVWPILCKIHGIKLPPFAIAIFCGTSKPPLVPYLEKFVAELKDLLSTGLKFGEKIISVHVMAFICDAPAKSYLKCVKNHNAYHGCDKCNQKGSWRGRVVFLNFNAPNIDDSDFFNKTFPNHQIDESPLLDLNVGLVSCFPIDYLHLVCLGTMRRLLYLWRDGAKYQKQLFSQKMCSLINNNLEKIKAYWPSDFNRKPRPLSDLERWKGTELRFFLLYLGPIVLKCLPPAAYDNFMCLHVAIFILLDENLNALYNNYANELLHLFVKTCSKIYGEEFIVYNTHGLLHLSADAKRFKKLDNISAFPFESFLGQLKRLLRNANNPVCQIVKRLEEGSMDKYILNYEHGSRIVENSKIRKTANEEDQFYSVAYINQQRFSNDLRDRAFMLKNGKIFIINKIKSINNEICFYGNTLKRAESFYDYPLTSEQMNVYKFTSISSNNLSNECVIRLSEIKCKGCLLPHKECFVFFPLHERV